MKDLDHLLRNNERWAKDMRQQDAEYFSRLVPQQTPKILWIGCADSRVPVSRIVGAQPGEVFVHRNIANVVAKGDASSASVIYYALEVLGAQHIVVCGHTGCGGVAAAMEEKSLGNEAIDGWLAPIREVCRTNAQALDAVAQNDRLDFMCRANVRAQLRNLQQNKSVQHIWNADRPLTLHGWLYNLENGLLKVLETVKNPCSVIL